MSSTLTPPPLPPASDPAAAPGPALPPPPSAGRGSARVIAILAIVLGSVIVLGVLVTSALSAIRAAAQRTETLTADAVGITDLDVDIDSGDVEIVYGGDEVTLTVTGNIGDWRLTRDEESLSVTTERAWWGGWRMFGDGDRAVLTLPSALQGRALDADLTLGAGSLRADGTYGDLDLDVSAGTMEVSGTAASIDADVSAGRLEFDLEGAREADVQLSAGAVEGTLSGRAPDAVTVDVSAGRLELTLPDEAYAVTSDVSAGTFRNGLDVDAGATHRVQVTVSAGFVGLRS